MSGSGNVRNPSYSDRRTSATLGNRPRVPSTRTDARIRPGSSDDVLPQDSASNVGSNAGGRRPVSYVHRANGISAHTINERQTEHHHVTYRDNIRLAIKSPLKPSLSDKEEITLPRKRESVVSGTKLVEEKPNHPPRKQEGPQPLCNTMRY